MRRWWEDAACWGRDDIDWSGYENARQAVNICTDCPVRRECLRDQMQFERSRLSVGVLWGVYGGTTPQMRADHYRGNYARRAS